MLLPKFYFDIIYITFRSPEFRVIFVCFKLCLCLQTAQYTFNAKQSLENGRSPQTFYFVRRYRS